MSPGTADAGQADGGTTDPALSAVVLRLLQGVFYRSADEALWMSLLSLREEVERYLRVLGLGLSISDAHGYSVLRPLDSADTDAASAAYRFLPHAALSASEAMLVVRLRKRLAELDVSGSADRLIVDHAELAAMLSPWVVDEDPTRPVVQAYIDRAVQRGFLRIIPSESVLPCYEVMRILEAWVEADWLTALEERLQSLRVEAGSHGTASETAR